MGKTGMGKAGAGEAGMAGAGMAEAGMAGAVRHRGGYTYHSAEHSHAHAYLMPCVTGILSGRGAGLRIFDLGCGNGSVAHALAGLGHEVAGVDPSKEGIAHANAAYPELRLERGDAYEPLAERFGQFDAVVSLEVVEHLYAPRDYARTLAALIRPGGFAIVSTPYHGYLKNLALALSGKMDRHFTALWDHGHIKFWSIATLTTLLEEAGLRVAEVHRVGRIPALAKGMVLVAEKPA